MFPDVGAGNPLSHIWWLSLAVLFICTIVASAIAIYLGNALQRKSQADDAQNKTITDLQTAFNNCRVNCANHRGEMVKRDDFEGRMLRMEEMIVRIHERVDQIGIAVGAEAIRKSE